MKCYADTNNNRDCCNKKKVPTECTAYGDTADCTDFCDGTKPHYDARAG
jgi:hypothetical protein